jgi:hypothetical protein
VNATPLTALLEALTGEHPRPTTTEEQIVTDQPVSFETDVKPLFREGDRDAMQSHFDLWSYDDVSEHADAILARLSDGTMPCDGPWPKAQVELFQRWAENGKPS